MKDKRIVVALGRNAFGETFPEQKKNVKKAAEAIADLVEQKYQVVITHSNGPQVGMIQTAMTEFARLDSRYTVAPMSLCGAMSQGYIGYDLQNAIRTELLNRGIFKPVSTVITQVRELKGFRKVMLRAGESREVTFTLTPDDLSFWRLDKKWGQEPGDYHVWVGHDSDCTLGGSFRITE